MNTTEDVSFVVSLIFELYDPLYISGTITNSNQITFTRDASDQKSITAFEIKLRNPDEQKRKEGIKLGEMVVNYLSAITEVPVRSKRPKIEKQQAGNTPQITNTPQQLDLDASKLSSLLSAMDPILNKKIANYQSGMTALEDNDPEKAVPRFHQVIEKEGDKVSAYYQPLRDACSHIVLDNGYAVNALNNDFIIKCKIHQPVDFTDRDNWQHLYSHVHALKQVVTDHMRKILPK